MNRFVFLGAASFLIGVTLIFFNQSLFYNHQRTSFRINPAEWNQNASIDLSKLTAHIQNAVNQVFQEMKQNLESAAVVPTKPTTASSCNHPLDRPRTVKYSGMIDDKITISHTDPATYEGPIVEGWPPLADRTTANYMSVDQGSVLLAPRDLNNDPDWCRNTRLLIFQHSRPSNFAVRMDNRNTWIHFSKEFPEMKAVFVVGRPQGANAEEINRRIQEEHRLYGDILQVDYLEHANNNTLKTLHILKYYYSIEWGDHEPEFFMKSDDDIYINVPKLIDFLFGPNAISKARPPDATRWPPLMGALFITPPVMQVEERMAKQIYTDYLITPSYMYEKPHYPSFTSGSAYIVPRWLVSCFYEQAQSMPYFHIEDVFMGGFVADRCLAPKKNMPNFSPGFKEIKDITIDHDWVVHYMNHDIKFQFHNMVTQAFNEAMISGLV